MGLSVEHISYTKVLYNGIKIKINSINEKKQQLKCVTEFLKKKRIWTEKKGLKT